MSKKLQQTEKRKNRVTWNPEGISKARLFLIEPWRRMNRKPLSSIRENNQHMASPFTFPCDASYIDPYCDYSTYVKSFPSMGCCTSVREKPNRPKTRSLTHSSTQESTNGQLSRSRTISLTEVYKIVERIKESNLIEKNNHSIDPLKERLDNDVLNLCG